jgi:cAMP-dependent protein kinase regulator
MASHTFPGRHGANPFGSSAKASTTNEPKPSRGISKVVEEGEGEETDTMSSPTSKATSSFAHNFSGGPYDDIGVRGGPPSSFKPSSEGFPSNYGMARRTSVSAESMNPTDASSDKWTPPIYPKTADQLERLKAAVSGHTLFKGLDEEQSRQIIGALVEKPIPAKNIKVFPSHLPPASHTNHATR